MININYTNNSRLRKPIGDEKYDEQIQNTNMDILDAEMASLKNKIGDIPSTESIEGHINDKSNPHNVTKEQIGLSEVQNTRQMNYVVGTVTNGGVPVFNGNGYSLKDSGFTISKSVPSDAKFTDTIYTHPSYTSGNYTKVTVDSQGHVISGSNPTTLSGYGITDADSKGTADATVTAHNISTDAHSDIRSLITELTNRLNSLIDSDDTTLDQMSEIIAYIKSNRELIDSITTSKVNVSDIVNNLVTNVSNKPLSAAQGVIIKSLIDTLQSEIDNKTDSIDLTSHTTNTSIHVTANEKSTWNNKSDFSGSYNDLTNKPTIPSIEGLATEDYVDSAIANAELGNSNEVDLSGYVTDLKLSESLGNYVEKEDGKGLSTNDYTTTEKTKLSGVATGAEVNQNAFSNVKVGSTTISADTKTDTLTLVAGDNVTITPDSTNDKITISSNINSELNEINTNDINGLLGTAGANVDAQMLIDAITDRVMNQLLAKSQLVANLLATKPGNPLDATMGRLLKNEVDSVIKITEYSIGNEDVIINSSYVKSLYMRIFVINKVAHITGNIVFEQSALNQFVVSDLPISSYANANAPLSTYSDVGQGFLRFVGSSIQMVAADVSPGVEYVFNATIIINK